MQTEKNVQKSFHMLMIFPDCLNAYTVSKPLERFWFSSFTRIYSCQGLQLWETTPTTFACKCNLQTVFAIWQIQLLVPSSKDALRVRLKEVSIYNHFIFGLSYKLFSCVSLAICMYYCWIYFSTPLKLYIFKGGPKTERLSRKVT